MSLPDSLNLGQAGKDLSSVLSLANSIRGLTASNPTLSSFGGPGFGISPQGVGTPSFRFSGPAVLSSTPGSIRSGLTDKVTGASTASQGIANQFGSLAGGAAAYAPEFTALQGDAASLRARLGSLAAGVDPATGRLATAVGDTYTRRSAEAMGNLRESLSRRGVLGSSFGNDAEARIAGQFGQEEAMTQAQVESDSIKLAQSLLETDARLITQQAGLIAQKLGLDEFKSGQLSKQLVAIRQSSDLIREGVSLELQELGVSAVVAQGLSSVVSNNAAFDMATAIKTSAAQGSIIANLAGTATGGAGILERVGNLAGRVLGNPTNVPSYLSSGTEFIPGFEGFGGDLLTGAEGAGELTGGIGSDILGGAESLFTGGNLASMLGTGGFAAAGAPIAMDIVKRIFQNNTYETPREPADFKVTDSPSHMNKLPQGADVSGLTVGEFWLLESLASTGPQAMQFSPKAQKYFNGRTGISEREARAIIADARARGIWDTFAKMPSQGIPAASGTGGGAV